MKHDYIIFDMPPVGRMNLNARLRKIVPTRPAGCWPWPNSCSGGGYGSISVSNKLMRAHRVFYLLMRGPIPFGMHLDHLCRNKRCVNPFHLEIVTNAENVRRGSSPCAVNFDKQFCISGHELSVENLIYRKSGERRCRKCNQRHCREYRSRARLNSASAEIGLTPTPSQALSIESTL